MGIKLFYPAVGNSNAELMVRSIAHNIGNQNDWPEKYGVDFESDVFAMRIECYCGEETCPQCWTESEHGRRAPNFHYKPAGLKMWWYKYIGRDTEIEGEYTDGLLEKIHNHCIDSFKSNNSQTKKC